MEVFFNNNNDVFIHVVRRGNCSRHEVVPTCGSPLGLSFEKKTGDLYICDGYLGVMKVGPEGGLAELVVDQAEGRKVMFANQMDIDEEEDVFYFNDSSDKYHFRYVLGFTKLIYMHLGSTNFRNVLPNLLCYLMFKLYLTF